METIHAVYRGEIKSIYIHQYFYCMIIKIKIHNNKDTYTRTYHMYLQFINNQRGKPKTKNWKGMHLAIRFITNKQSFF